MILMGYWYKYILWSMMVRPFSCRNEALHLLLISKVKSRLGAGMKGGHSQVHESNLATMTTSWFLIQDSSSSPQSVSLTVFSLHPSSADLDCNGQSHCKNV